MQKTPPSLVRLLTALLATGVVGCASQQKPSPDSAPPASPVAPAKAAPAAEQAAATPTAIFGKEKPLPKARTAAPEKSSVAPSKLMQVLADALNAHKAELEKKGNPKPYFISYTLADAHRTRIQSAHGALMAVEPKHTRRLDIQVRVGSPKLDNTNLNRGAYGGFNSVSVVLGDDPDALKQQIWRATDEAYRGAARAFIKVQTNEKVQVEEEDPSDDFSAAPVAQHYAPLPVHTVDLEALKKRARTWSAPFAQASGFLNADLRVDLQTEHRIYVNSEGTRVQHGNQIHRISAMARVLADDGMHLVRHESREGNGLSALPSDDDIVALVKGVLDDARALEKAPVADPWAGPVILSGRAAGVFFHEVFGHRVEGHRQRSEISGQTFTRDLEKGILPRFLSVRDDPTVVQYGDVNLMGHYLFDDEGVAAQPVELVKDGRLKTFLTSRLPIAAVPKSNGHGRKEVGRPVVARMGNLLVQPSHVVSVEELRALLVAELKKQGKEYGYRVDDISGGFTNTVRFGPQAFKVTPTMVYRVYADGRPDELVRGVDVAGTPKTVFSKIIAAADDHAVFNGMCGAESGWVPVSAASPSLLLSELEIERKAKSSEKAPILPPPQGVKK
jgi:predicted Zn-dependent protease